MSHISPLTQLPSNLSHMGNLFKTKLFVQLYTGLVGKTNSRNEYMNLGFINFLDQPFIKKPSVSPACILLIQVNGNFAGITIGLPPVPLMNIGIPYHHTLLLYHKKG